MFVITRSSVEAGAAVRDIFQIVRLNYIVTCKGASANSGHLSDLLSLSTARLAF